MRKKRKKRKKKDKLNENIKNPIYKDFFNFEDMNPEYDCNDMNLKIINNPISPTSETFYNFEIFNIYPELNPIIKEYFLI